MTIIKAGICCVALFLLGSTSWADDHSPAPVAFHIEARSLKSALTQFGEQSGLQILFSKETVEGLSAPGVTGTFTPEAALQQLIAHTGLRYEFVNPHTVRIWIVGSSQNAPAAHDATENLRVPQVDQGAAGPQAVDNRNTENKKKDEGLTEIVVTGTHIRGTAPVGSALKIYTSQDIEQSGAATLGEFARTLPENFSSIDPTISKQSLAVGQTPFNQASSNTYNGAAFNLHGIGPGATLTLLNGHRVAPAGFDGSFTDISQIPLAAIDHIEVLPDGASAIYGTDAVAGVVNIITRKDFSGAQTGLRYGFATNGGGQETTASQLFGTSWAGGNLMGTYEYYHQNALDASQRDYLPSQGGPQSLAPKTQRNSFLLSGNQDIGADSTLSGDATFSDRKSHPFTTLDIQNLFTQAVKTDNHAQQSGLTLSFDQRLRGDWHTVLTGNYSRVQQSFNNDTEYTGLLQQSQLQRGDDDTQIASAESTTDGTLISIPGGAVKAAVDFGFRREKYRSFSALSQNGVPVPPLDLSAQRSVANAAAEVRVPLIGESNAKAWAKKLELSLAVRYDHYDDFGSATNPKYGLRWEPFNGLDLRATYGTSFRAPLLSQLIGGQTYSTSSASDAQSPTGFTDTLELDGNNPGLLPEKSKSFTAGFDLRPPSLTGLSLSGTYFHYSYSDRIAVPPVTSADIFAEPALASFITRNPSLATVQALFGSPNFTIDQAGGGPAAVQAIFDNRNANIAGSRVAGFEVSIAYAHPSDYGDFNVSVSGDRQLHNDFQPSPTGPSVSLINIVAEPPSWRARGNAGWSLHGVHAMVALNYTGRYENVNFTPSQSVASWLTTDVYLSYAPGETVASGFLRNLTVALSVSNLADVRPPRVLLPDAVLFGGLIPQLPYDPVNANAMGRFIALNVTKKWGGK